MNPRRIFFKKSLALAGALSLTATARSARAESISDALLSLKKLPPLKAAQDEDLWERIAQSFTVSPTYLNLNNAGASPQPTQVQDALERYNKISNELPTFYMTQILDDGKEELRRRLANLAGVSTEEIAVVRNATEALGIVTYGLTLQRGDEIVMCRQDYPNMMHAWTQRSIRDGIKVSWLNLSIPFEDEEAIVQQFISATTKHTKVWHITHMINWNGQIMPVKKLCEEARKRNITTIVDGAQSFAQMDFTIRDFNPDYFGASLHKWLCAPFGTGLLYVNKSNIGNLWPLFPNHEPQSEDIRKFESFGTRSVPNEHATGQAIAFHEAVGGRYKEERLRYLTNYWCEKLRQNERIKLNISLKPELSCGVGHFSIDGMEPERITARLKSEHRIHSVMSKIEGLNGVRISPHIYTLPKDLDRFTEAVSKLL